MASSTIYVKESVECAREFLKKYHDEVELVSNELKDNMWKIMFDVGYVKRQLKEVRVDAVSKKILGHRDASITADMDQFASMVLHYTNNVKKCLKNKDYATARRMTWYALTYTIKTVAAKENKSVDGHKNLSGYAMDLAKREKDKYILYGFSEASNLHYDYCTSNLPADIILDGIQNVFKTINKLMDKMKYEIPRLDDQLFHLDAKNP